MPNEFLKTTRLYLRALEKNDLNRIQEWLSDKDFTQLLFQGDIPKNLEKIKQDFVDNVDTKKDIIFAIVEKENNEHIGWAGLYEINWLSRNAELRFFIGKKELWNKGFASETVSVLIDYGFDKLNLHRLYGGANLENIGSVSVFKKLGFSEEGVSKEGFFRNGRYYDLIHFGLINPNETSK